MIVSAMASVTIVMGLGLAFGWDWPLFAAMAAIASAFLVFSRLLPWLRFEREDRERPAKSD